MPRLCTICVHSDRVAIDKSLVAGQSFAAIAALYRVSEDAVSRHRVHIPAAMAKAQEAKEAAQGEDLLEQVKAFRNKALALMQKAESAGDLKTAIAGLREARACLELLLEVEGELDRRPQINLVVSSEWLQVRAVLFLALAPYPEARQAVSQQLLAVGAV